MKVLVDDIVVIYDGDVDTPENTSIIPNAKTNYWLFAVVLLAVACLLLLVVIYESCNTILCSLIYYYRDG